MIRVLTVAFMISVALSFGSCMSPCRKAQKTNARLIAGKQDFGKKTKKWKRKQHY